MGKSAVLNQARQAVRSGQDRHQVFETYKDQVSRPLQLAFAIAGVPDPERKARFQAANIALVILLLLAALGKLVTAITMFQGFGLLPVLGLALLGVLLPTICAIEVARFNGQIYALIPLFCLASLFQVLRHFSGDYLGLAVDLAFLAAILGLSLWIKIKVFPNLGLGGVKKDAQGRYLF